MKTSHLLPQECKEEIKPRIAQLEKIITICKETGKDSNTLTLFNAELNILRWILGEEK